MSRTSGERYARRSAAGAVWAAWVALWTVALVWLCAGAGARAGQQEAATAVTVRANTNSTVQPGDALELTLSNLRHSIAAADVAVAFARAGTSPPTATAHASSARDLGNGSCVITVEVPASLKIEEATSFDLRVSGSDTAGVPISSANAVRVKIERAAGIVSLSKGSGHAGQSVTVTIAGHNTNFIQGETQAGFGPGVSVGGAVAGAPGPVAVRSPTEAVAVLRIDGEAGRGGRDVTIRSGARTLSAKGIFQIEPALRPPALSSGGPYTGFAGKAVSFDASQSLDGNESPLSFAWEMGDGSKAVGAEAQHIYKTPGTYPVTLTGTDALGASAMVHTTVTIFAPAQRPVAIAGGPYTGSAGQSVAFNASGSIDPNGEALRYTWNFGDGAIASGASPTHIYDRQGTFPVTLTAVNGSGESASVTTQASIGSTTQQLAAIPGGPYTADAGVPVQFDGSASGGEGLRYSWSFGDGQSGSGANPQHVYAMPGTYTLTLTVEDGRGGSDSAVTTIVVPEVKKPVANAGGPYTGTAEEPVEFNGSKSSDPNGYKLTYSWTFGDQTTGTGAKPTHTYKTAGDYKVELTVNDGHGGTASASTTAKISAAVPIADTGGPYAGIPGQPIHFDGTQSIAPPHKTLTFEWKFGDKTTAKGAAPTHKYAAAGAYTVTLTVSDGTASATATTKATITQVVAITIASPTPGTLTKTPTIAVSGTVAAGATKVVVNRAAATISAGKWAAKSVTLREGVNLITATATAKNGATGTASVSVTLDTTAPSVSIVSPAQNARVFSPQLTVSGLVSDLVAGTVNAQNVSVSVNGVAASVVNRSFSAPGVLLSPGLNTIQVVATDKAGNTGQASVQVSYKAQITQQTILLVSGDGQTGVINSTLKQPLVAQLVAANGQPVGGRPVTFTVTRSDGEVEVLPSEGNTLSVLTDVKGRASVLFKLGSRAGVGINQVTASSPGFTGQAVFSATSTNDTPAHIHTVIGEHQRGIIGQHAPQPFQVIVTDRMGNPLQGIAVTFTVTAGGGNIGDETKVTQETNADGKATVSVTLGMQEGIDNNLVVATFAGNKGSPVVFHASGIVPGPPAQTTVTGVVLDNTNTPIHGATASLEGTNLRTTTDVHGHFTLKGVPVGTVTLLVDGSTSSSSSTFPSLSFVLQALPGVTNSLDKPIYVPAIDVENAQTVGGDEPVTLTMKGVPGVAFTVQPNSVTFPDGSHVGKLSLSQVKTDMVPMEPVNGVAAPLVWTLQPAGAKFDPPIQVQLPNTEGMAPGTVTEIYSYDHDLEQFVSGGTARVSPDGSVIVSDPGFGIVKAGWGHNLPPPPPNNCTISCNDHNDCTNDVVTGDCGCRHIPINIGGNCNGTKVSNSCMTVGVCDQFGVCGGSKNLPDGTSCNDNLYCTKDKMCKSGSCTGMPIPDEKLPPGETVGVDLTNMFGPLQGFVDTFISKPYALTFQVNQSSGGVKSCCEQQQGAMLEKKNDKYSLRIQGTGDFPTPYSITSPAPQLLPFELGLYVQVAVYIQSGIAVNYDKCADNTCVSADQGQLSFGLGPTLKIKAGPPNLQLEAGAGASMVITVNLNTTDCHTLQVSSNIGAFKLSTSLTIPGIKLKIPASYTFPGTGIPGPTYTFK